MRTAVALLLLTAANAHADPVWAVRPEPGLVCMTSQSAQIVEQPRADAQSLAIAGPVVFVITPKHIDGGYVEIERPNKQVGWVAQSALSAGPVGCVPTLMSNGLVLAGFMQ